MLLTILLRKKDPSGAAEWLTKADALDGDNRRSRKAVWAAIHAQLGEWDAAVTAQEKVFAQNVVYDEYRQLMEYAAQVGEATAVRESAVTYLQKGKPDWWWSDGKYAYTPVQIFRDEQDWPALRETAVQRIRDPDRLLDAARWLADPAPDESNRVYERSVEAFIRKKKKRIFQTAARVLLEAKPAFEAVSATAFDDCIVRLREEHYRKRSFIALLDAMVPTSSEVP